LNPCASANLEGKAEAFPAGPAVLRVHELEPGLQQVPGVSPPLIGGRRSDEQGHQPGPHNLLPHRPPLLIPFLLARSRPRTADLAFALLADHGVFLTVRLSQHLPPEGRVGPKPIGKLSQRCVATGTDFLRCGEPYRIGPFGPADLEELAVGRLS
jgi:hypothetical protein